MTHQPPEVLSSTQPFPFVVEAAQQIPDVLDQIQALLKHIRETSDLQGESEQHIEKELRTIKGLLHMILTRATSNLEMWELIEDLRKQVATHRRIFESMSHAIDSNLNGA